MNEQAILQMFAANTVHVLIFGILIGALFSLATMATLEGLKAYNAEKKKPAAKKKKK